MAHNLYPEPTTHDLERPEFLAVWYAIRRWDIKRNNEVGYASSTGNDVMYILNSIKNYCCVSDQKTIMEIVKNKLPVENQHLADDIADAIMQDMVFRKLSA
jgi:hypothetical protein